VPAENNALPIPVATLPEPIMETVRILSLISKVIM